MLRRRRRRRRRRARKEPGQSAGAVAAGTSVSPGSAAPPAVRSVPPATIPTAVDLTSSSPLATTSTIKFQISPKTQSHGLAYLGLVLRHDLLHLLNVTGESKSLQDRDPRGEKKREKALAPSE